MTSKLLLAVSGLVLGLSLQGVVAGTIKASIGGCQLDSGFRRCEWEPSFVCSKPFPPSTSFVFSVQDYNFAVDEYNSYLEDANRYLRCVSSEAKSDIDNVPDLIAESVRKLSTEIQIEVDAAENALDRARLFLR